VSPGGVESVVYNTMPYSIPTPLPGIYSVTQDLFSRKMTEYFYVRPPILESDFNRTEGLASPTHPEAERLDYDLYLYLAAALLGMVLIERLLAKRDL
jgi:hypothetical protein